MKKIKKFYNFWFNFESWRDFEVEGEHKVEEAENRWEKRQMLKENKKLKQSAMKEERQRLVDLIELAYKNDPRIIAEEAKIAETREKNKQERLEKAKQDKIDREEKEKRLKEENEEKKRNKIEEATKLKDNLNNELMNMIKLDFNMILTSDETFQIMLNANVTNLTLILKEVKEETDKDEQIHKFKTLGNKHMGLKFVDEVKESYIWNKLEISALQKSIKKYPIGTPSRWEKIIDMVKTKGSEQIYTMTQHLAMNPNMKISGDTLDLKALILGNSNDITKITKNSCKDFKSVNKEKEIDPNAWSESQQKSLETALKKYPGSLPANERWTKISNDVQDKNKKQCVERFKYISSLIKKAK